MTPARFLSIDDTFWPLLVIRMHGSPTDEQYQDYLDMMTRYLRRGEAYTSIIDMSQAGVSTPGQRQLLADWCRENDRLLRERLLGTSFIVTSALQRLLVNVVFYLKPPTQPHIVVARWEQALPWAADRLEAAGFARHAAQVRRHPALRSAASGG
ncbi:hypothetical protein [Melittangium boletus]|uniref:hypothetical protein n=1 Tax=Melittangium boletus TaxID=83453 RepID=UPI000BB2D661|nr:hypothetical protein [Melittangium boletus]